MTLLAQIGQRAAALETNTRAGQFIDCARMLMLSESHGGSPEQWAVIENMPKAVVDHCKANIAGTLEFPADEQTAAAFLATVASVSAFDQIALDSNQLPLHVRVGVMTTRPAGAAVGAGAAKPVGQGDVTTVLLDERKAVSLVVASNEILRLASTANALIGNALRQAVAVAVDSVFIAALVSATTPIAASGITAAAAILDIRKLIDAIGPGDGSRLHMIVSPLVAGRLAMMQIVAGQLVFNGMTPQGGTIQGIPVHVSTAAGTAVIMVDARGLATGSEAIRLRASQNAAVEMDTAPSSTIGSGSPLAPTESNLVSMFQTNSTALLAERFWGFSILRTAAVQSLSGVAWAT
jgi:hypothetical protein